MSKAILTLASMPTSCDKCPLFIRHFGHPAYCAMHAEYTPEEIAAVENGNLDLYYNGCLSTRPKECPLERVEQESKIERHVIEPTFTTPLTQDFSKFLKR